MQHGICTSENITQENKNIASLLPVGVCILYVSICTHTRTHARTHARTHTHTYTHTHSQTHELLITTDILINGSSYIAS